MCDIFIDVHLRGEAVLGDVFEVRTGLLVHSVHTGHRDVLITPRQISKTRFKKNLQEVLILKIVIIFYIMMTIIVLILKCLLDFFYLLSFLLFCFSSVHDLFGAFLNVLPSTTFFPFLFPKWFPLPPPPPFPSSFLHLLAFFICLLLLITDLFNTVIFFRSLQAQKMHKVIKRRRSSYLQRSFSACLSLPLRASVSFLLVLRMLHILELTLQQLKGVSPSLFFGFTSAPRDRKSLRTERSVITMKPKKTSIV